MKDRLDALHHRALTALAELASEEQAEHLRVALLGRKGELTAIVRSLKDVPPEERPAMGALINEIKDDIEQRIAVALGRLREQARDQQVARERVDVTVPGRRRAVGHFHPIQQTLHEIVDVFVSLGFAVAEGPDIEDEHHNFNALNIPADHPARDMQDTFFVRGDYLLRTHTSPVQIRVMESQPPPLRVVVPGAVYRHDSDVTHSPMFHQVEGLLVDRNVTFADLKGVLALALRRIFGEHTKVRFRASFFPFTEPSAEVDIGCLICGGKSPECRVCKGSGWLEVLGAGLVDPNVFAAVGYDPEEVSGFAFGMGVERIAMLKYRINDIRLLFANDARFLHQF
ncbi:MAG TPA: phenylalanine--tRNA ligase subunit alpha [Terriglobales bacterium]|nr:phenylalanine--tRNA ligase subunit alpha [Terriglobales bacterium]